MVTLASYVNASSTSWKLIGTRQGTASHFLAAASITRLNCVVSYWCHLTNKKTAKINGKLHAHEDLIPHFALCKLVAPLKSNTDLARPNLSSQVPSHAFTRPAIQTDPCLFEAMFLYAMPNERSEAREAEKAKSKATVATSQGKSHVKRRARRWKTTKASVRS
eukprot:5045072-Amphidinium_carterae.1